MIDYHCHLLPGLDDGPDSVDESLVMARALAAFGFREVHCTPHCIAGQYEISPVEVRDAVRKLQARLDREGIALALRPGMEYYLDEYFERFAANLLPLGESRLVLCEAPPQAPPELVGEMASLVVIQGFIPLIAHPERSESVWRLIEAGDAKDEQPEAGSVQREASDAPRAGRLARLFSRLKRSSSSAARPVSAASRPSPADSKCSPLASRPALLDACLYQANLGSFVGYYGPLPQRRAYELLQRGVYHCLASDLHEAPSATALLEQVRDKLDFNPALRKLGNFKAPQGQGGSDQLAFW